MGCNGTLNIVFSITYYLNLQNTIFFTTDVIVYLVHTLMFYNVQKTKLTFVGKKMRYTTWANFLAK